MKTLRVLALVGMISLAANLHSHAASLILIPGVPTDLNGSPLDVTYDATSGSFQVTGSLSDYIDSSDTDTGDFGFYGSYSISATIDKNTGIVASGGTVTISDIYSDTLLTGNLESGASGTAWGYYNNSSVDQFSFLFNVTSGDAASDFGGVGALCGINLFADFSGNSPHDTAFSGTWGGNFDNLDSGGANTGNGSADIFPVPEPSSVLLTLVGGVLCLVARRRLSTPRV